MKDATHSEKVILHDFYAKATLLVTLKSAQVHYHYARFRFLIPYFIFFTDNGSGLVTQSKSKTQL